MIAVGLAGVLVVQGALAQSFPSRQMTLIYPFPAGSAADLLCRVLAAEMTKMLGKPMIVENRPGAGGRLSINAIMAARGDPHIMAFNTNGGLVIQPLADPAMKI